MGIRITYAPLIKMVNMTTTFMAAMMLRFVAVIFAPFWEWIVNKTIQLVPHFASSF